MYNDYYYNGDKENPIYLSIITQNKSVEISLYQSNELLLRESRYMGSHVLYKDDIQLMVKLKMFKINLELTIGEQVIALEKIKRKALCAFLDTLKINNDINPVKLPKEPLTWKRFKTPLILILISVIYTYLTRDFGKFSEIPSMIILLIAYYQLFSPLINRVHDYTIDRDTKGKLKFVSAFVFTFLTHVLVDHLIQSFKL